MWKYFLNDRALSHLSKIDKKDQERIISKLDYFVSSPNPMFYAKRLTDSKLGSFRFRIGDYRIIFDVDEAGKIIIIAVIGKRGEIYE